MRSDSSQGCVQKRPHCSLQVASAVPPTMWLLHGSREVGLARMAGVPTRGASALPPAEHCTGRCQSAAGQGCGHAATSKQARQAPTVPAWSRSAGTCTGCRRASRGCAQTQTQSTLLQEGVGAAAGSARVLWPHRPGTCDPANWPCTHAWRRGHQGPRLAVCRPEQQGRGTQSTRCPAAPRRHPLQYFSSSSGVAL
jgi:hypothetical protein